jgi:hypothetical protein
MIYIWARFIDKICKSNYVAYMDFTSETNKIHIPSLTLMGPVVSLPLETIDSRQEPSLRLTGRSTKTGGKKIAWS